MLNEAETRAKLIDLKLHESGWSEDLIQRELKITEGRIIDEYGNRKEGVKPDYILFLERYFPIAVVESKEEAKHHAAGIQQAKRYREMLNVPFAYSTNGHKIEEYDFITKNRGLLINFRHHKNYGKDTPSGDLIDRCRLIKVKIRFFIHIKLLVVFHHQLKFTSSRYNFNLSLYKS